MHCCHVSSVHLRLGGRAAVRTARTAAQAAQQGERPSLFAQSCAAVRTGEDAAADRHIAGERALVVDVGACAGKEDESGRKLQLCGPLHETFTSGPCMHTSWWKSMGPQRDTALKRHVSMHAVPPRAGTDWLLQTLLRRAPLGSKQYGRSCRIS